MLTVCVCDRRRPDGLSTVKVDEKERFEDIKERLRVILENHIVNFRWLPWWYKTLSSIKKK